MDLNLDPLIPVSDELMASSQAVKVTPLQRMGFCRSLYTNNDGSAKNDRVIHVHTAGEGLSRGKEILLSVSRTIAWGKGGSCYVTAS